MHTPSSPRRLQEDRAVEAECTKPAGFGPDRHVYDRITEARLDALEAQMADVAVTMREAVAAGMREALTDPDVLAAVWTAAMKQGRVGLHQRVGRLVISKWMAIAALCFTLATYIGWPATLKILVGLVKGDAP